MEICIVTAFLGASILYLLVYFVKQTILRKLALLFLSAGFLCNLYWIASHVLATHRLPLVNISETLISIVSIIVFIFLVFDSKRRDLETMGVFISLISAGGMAAAFWLFKRPEMPLLPALQSRWLPLHVASCIIAYGFFTISFAAAIVYLTGRNLKSGKRSFLIQLMHRSVCLGFYFLTLGIILGSIWGKSAWGHWWNWDPKETWALVTWFIYAGFIHNRLFGNWSEKRLSIVSVIGFFACLFTYFGVNLLLKGLHSYA